MPTVDRLEVVRGERRAVGGHARVVVAEDAELRLQPQRHGHGRHLRRRPVVVVLPVVVLLAGRPLLAPAAALAWAADDEPLEVLVPDGDAVLGRQLLTHGVGLVRGRVRVRIGVGVGVRVRVRVRVGVRLGVGVRARVRRVRVRVRGSAAAPG